MTRKQLDELAKRLGVDLDESKDGSDRIMFAYSPAGKLFASYDLHTLCVDRAEPGERFNFANIAREIDDLTDCEEPGCEICQEKAAG